MDPTACEGCESAAPHIEFSVRGWIGHILWLDRLKECGCRFLLDDLTLDEWRGLEVLNDERNKYERKKLKEPGK